VTESGRAAVLLAGNPVRLGQGEERHRRAAERVDVPERGDPDQRVLARGLLRGDPDGVADAEALVVGGGLVDDDLVVGRRLAALDVGQRVEALWPTGREAEGGRAVAAARLAV
jgi:hypothetical protein